jgi:hypothetical protein
MKSIQQHLTLVRSSSSDRWRRPRREPRGAVELPGGRWLCRAARTGGAVAAALCLTFVSRPASVLATPITRLVPASIGTAGRTDVTHQLQQFIDSVPDGATVVFPHAARYRIDGTLEWRGRRDVTLDGNGATLFAGTHGGPDRAEVRLIDGAHWTIRDLTIVGANASPGQFDAKYQWQHGIDLRGVDGALIENVTVRNVWGDDIYVGLSTTPDARWSRNVSIINSTGIGSGRMAIAITAGRNVLVRGGFWSNPGLSTFDVEPNGPTGGAVWVVIEGVKVGAGRRGSALSIAGSGPVSDIVLQNNRLTGRALTVLADQGALRPHDLRVRGNVSTVMYDGPDPAAMFFHNADGVAISANKQPLRAGGLVALVATQDSTRVRVTDQEPYLHLAPVAGPAATVLIMVAAALLYLVVVAAAWRWRR